MDTVIKYLESTPFIRELKLNLNNQNQKILINNINDNIQSVVISNLFKTTDQNIIVVVPNLYSAQKLYDRVVQILDSTYVHFFPMDEFISAEMLASSDEFRQERITSLIDITQGKQGVIITHTLGAIRKLPPKRVFEDNIIHLRTNDIVDFDELTRSCINNGYKRQTVVEKPGDLAVRGGIIDIYPFTSDHPFRVEFFDDEVESIRTFEEKTQRSIEKITEVFIPPMYELVYNDEQKQQAIDKLTSEFKNKLKGKKPYQQELLEEQFEKEISNIDNHNELSRVHKYIDYLYEETDTLIDYMKGNALIVFSEYNNIINNYNNFEHEYQEYIKDLLDDGKSLFIPQHYVNLDFYINKPHNKLFFLEHTTLIKDIKFNQSLFMSSKTVEKYYGDLDLLYSELKKNKNKTYCLCFKNRNQADRFTVLLEEQQISYSLIGAKDKILENKVNIVISNLSEGFELINEQVKFITNSELYKKPTKVVKYRSTIKEATRIKNVDELNVSDFIVHNEHGIGRYLGIKTLVSNGISRDFLQIAYKGDDKLYVPVEKIDQIQKYVGGEGAKPKIHKIGGTEWIKTKKSVTKRVKDIADKLIKLYSEREHTSGYAFTKDFPEQEHFEEDFPYVETRDQLTAVDEIKKDMETQVPMDRLLCGDVGYGKTEVAMRAAFKAVMDNKQVAYLAPTTILTQQHYDSFVERFRNFPINIALLNRYVSKKDQQEIIKKTKKKQIDIVIGTHRLLSKDIKFQDLGLLVVDEEQRFGVEHKERIKELKVNVDVLTLTATPIPRTMQMSLIGVRSLSLLETPPENRYPVQTYVIEENDTIIKDAIERELSRDGQVFFLHNRVSEIDHIVSKVKRLVPGANVTFAHGQMSKEQLENTMYSFLKKKFDVLVCTTIIETGIDISNANTLIISNSDKLGLSQLYQLRGRVGRSDRIAYAYLMYPKRKVLTEIANKRLQAIKDFTELGSGFKIAKQDLAIRGAGDLLGAKQYGFIDSVGFEMYNKLLKEAIEERKEEKEEIKKYNKEITEIKQSDDIDIRLNINAYIPNDYIKDESLKIEIYKKIKLLDHIDDLYELEHELKDRFSSFPQPVENLLNIAYIKSKAIDLGINKITETKTQVEFIFEEEASTKLDGEKLFTSANLISPNIRFKYMNSKIIMTIEKPRLKENYLMVTRKLFLKLTNVE
ncbi:transcription-repair coupling factor [Haloplasma contractile]|uniref:Transcription-repair-coupling factor n=1 Tax=Haloplasma contractile SSD-17B TaxID=1033810 RepID=U2FI19_9MOLU|nr:transcription-repair coupling factor [Haloplasma contractile]ERJ12460.1 transcription-repair coupling factor superfamily II helicase protein [Haloplasma contractile SSD-17B]